MTADLTTQSLIQAILSVTGWKQEQLALELDTSQSQVSRWRNGASANWDDGMRIKSLAGRVGALTNITGTNTMGFAVAVRGHLKASGAISWEPIGDMLRTARVPFPLPSECMGFLLEEGASSQRAMVGDLLVAGPLTGDVDDMLGVEVVAETEGGDYFFGIMVAGRQPETFSVVGPKGFVAKDVSVVRAAPYLATVAAGRWEPN